MQQAHVGRHAVAGFELDDIARDELGDRNGLGVAVATHAREWREHGTQAGQCLFGTALLDVAHHGVDKHDQHDDRGIHPVADHGGEDCSNEQKVDERAVELGNKSQQRGAPSGGRQLVAAVHGQPAGRFLCAEAAVRAVELLDHVLGRLCVPGGLMRAGYLDLFLHDRVCMGMRAE